MKILSLFILALLLGCSSFTKKVDKEALKQVKKVALVGYTVDYKKPLTGKNLLAHVLTGSERDDGYGKIIKSIDENLVSKQTYNDLTKKIEAMTGWQFVPYSKVVRSPTISRMYQMKKKTVQTGVPPLRGGNDRLERSRIPQTYYIHQADINDKRKLAKELGVDAIVTARIITHVNQFKVLGIGFGDLKFQSNVILEVLEPNRDESILRISEMGEEISSVDSKFMGFNSEDEHMKKTYKGIYVATDELLNEMKAEM